MTGLGLSHPELVRRFNLLVAECWANGWECGITSSTRSKATQEDLYRRWLAGTYKVPSVANPNAPHGPSPWGWTIVGSYHMPQADGFSHALDLHWRGCTPSEFERLANKCGLQRTVPNENWHYQWFNRQVIFPGPPEPPPQQEDKLIAIIVADAGDQTWYVTDFVSKRPLADGNELVQLRDHWNAKCALNGGPLPWPRAWVDAIPN